MKALVIGTGAAGNKAVINLVEKGVVSKDDIMLINSTLKDIPKEYFESSILLSTDYDGCGKQRHTAKKITLEALANGTLDIISRMKQEYEKIIIATSLEGGTGSGSSIILADYCVTELAMNVEIYTFTGFKEDIRGLANTVDFFKDLENNKYTVQVIRNDIFLKEKAKSMIEAQKMANDEFALRVKISLGQLIIPSENNIDDTDLYKVATTVGYSTVEYIEVEDKIKSKEEFNNLIKEMLDSSKSLHIENPRPYRLAIITNLQENSQNYIDYGEDSELVERFGDPYESFKHIQYTKDMDEFIAIIASGMKMPKDEVESIYKDYKKRSDSIDKTADDFFEAMDKIKGNKEDAMFNMSIERRKRFVKDDSSKVKAAGNNSKFFNKYKINEESDY